VVVEGTTQVPGRSRAGLWIGVALGVAVAAAVAVVIVMKGKGSEGREPSAAGSVDAGAKSQQVDAGRVAMAVDAGHAPSTVVDAGAGGGATTPADMVKFDGGDLKMGIDPAKAKKIPLAEAHHQVKVAPFYLDRTEMTIAGMRAAGGAPADGKDSMPAVRVAWTDADAACRAVGKRLPTAAEWEFAARSAPLDAKKASLLHEKRGGPAPVGTHPGDCTPDGVCDLLGNVMEWTADDWPKKAGFKVVRGASFSVGVAAGWYASVQARLPFESDAGDSEIGFRCAADLKAP
jgi:formylglycine-generating enzyme required for sulfatase activity